MRLPFRDEIRRPLHIVRLYHCIAVIGQAVIENIVIDNAGLMCFGRDKNTVLFVRGEDIIADQHFGPCAQKIPQYPFSRITL